MPTKKRTGTIHRTIFLLEKALSGLHAGTSLQEIERIAVMVHRGMSRRQRSFHTPEHIFDLADPDDPHGTLAALFHDLVYYQVDEGFDGEIEALITPYISIGTDGAISLARELPETTREFNRCAAVFGFSPGQKLSPFTGLNEFLSALVMNLLFEDLVPEMDLFIATACIEATIPFRTADEHGNTPPQRLRARLKDTVAAAGVSLHDQDLDRTVIRAVTFANRDVRNFAEEDVGRFLDNTWKLLPETNPELRFVGVYTIKSYRVAVQKMRGFISFLDPECVFQRYNAHPDQEEYAYLQDRTRRNLEAARAYLGIKFLTATILESLATITGSDAPVALFMGEIDKGDCTGLSDAPGLEQIIDYLPVTNARHDTSLDDTVYRLLDTGRAGATGFDLKNSPLSLFVYRSIGAEQIPAAIDTALTMCDEKMSREAFLESLPGDMIAAIATAAAEMVLTRRKELTALAERFRPARSATGDTITVGDPAP